jgi:hypothetical protein
MHSKQLNKSAPIRRLRGILLLSDTQPHTQGYEDRTCRDLVLTLLQSRCRCCTHVEFLMQYCWDHGSFERWNLLPSC